MMMISGVR